MRIIFITDLHFGILTQGAVESFLEFINKENPDFMIIGGDLTQRAFHSQYREARQFLDQLPCPWICVPGNHDVPAWNLLDRFASPLRLYKKYIHPELDPVFQNDQFIVAGINSARRTPHDRVWEQGKISNRQLAHIQDIFAKADPALLKMVVVHHPLVFLPSGLEKLRVNNYAAALQTFKQCGVDIVFTGHLHRVGLQIFDNMVMVQGGTSFSSRLRDDVNQFFKIKLHPENKIEFSPHVWSDEKVFAVGKSEWMHRGADGVWQKLTS